MVKQVEQVEQALQKLHGEGTTYNTEHRKYPRTDIAATRLNRPQADSVKMEQEIG